MLDIKTAKIIKKAIDEHFAPSKDVVSLEDVCRMEPVSVSAKHGGYTILAHQHGDLTILVWVQFSETLGVCIRNVKGQGW